MRLIIMQSDKFNGKYISWIISDEKVCLKEQSDIYCISSAEIVRIEFKGQSSANGIIINTKPSEILNNLHFNRFPCELKLIVQMPTDTHQRPQLNLVAYSGSASYAVDCLPDSDQIILDNKNWFPLFIENVNEITKLLESINIEGFGTITLKQALELIKSNSQAVVCQTIPVSETVFDNFNKNLDQILTDLSDNRFSAKLYPYQENGFSWLKSIAEESLGCILADEMGLGKTLQIIALLSYFKMVRISTSLVIAPATLLENWRREFARFSPGISTYVHSGINRTGFPSHLIKFDVVICSYDTAVRDQGLFKMIEWDFIILDEAQAIKNSATRRSLAVKGLKRGVAIAVTGTPVENSLSDLWSIMDFTCPGLLGSFDEFDSVYDDDYQSAQNVEKLVSPLILRRRVSDVAKDLPDKVIIPQTINMSDAEICDYEAIRQNIAVEYGKSATLVSLLRLRQFCAHPLLIDLNSDMSEYNIMSSSKYIRLIEILEEIVQNGEKTIIFASFTKMIDIISDDIPKRFNIPSWKIDGRTPVPFRQDIVDQFSKINGAAILVLNPKAAGTGLNITAANHVIHYTLEWNPAVEDQATARAHRRGQVLPVFVHRLFYPDTVEEVINDRLDRKRDLADVAIVGTEAREVEAADIIRAMELSPSRNMEEGEK